MSSRPVWLALALAAAVVPSADAAPRPAPKPKPLCSLLTDPPNDAVGPGGVQNEAFNNGNLDIIGAEFGSDTKQFTMVVRVRKIAQPDDTSPLGQRWTFAFNIGNERFSYMTSVNRLTTNYPEVGTGGIIDPVKNEIRMHVPLADINRRGVATKDGTVVKNIDVSAGAYLTTPREAGFGGGSYLYQVDAGTTTRVYPLRASSCVRVGQ